MSSQVSSKFDLGKIWVILDDCALYDIFGVRKEQNTQNKTKQDNFTVYSMFKQTPV